ncbi:MAG: DDE-type integrase/transposase/recombinase [Nitrososphaeria archaeon]
MAGLSSWEIADAMEDRRGRKPPHSSMLYRARALGSVGWTVPPRGRWLVAVDETAERVNGREVYVWAAMDVDTGELPAMKATWSRSSMDALLFLRRVLRARTMVSFNDMNAGRSRIASLDGDMKNVYA